MTSSGPAPCGGSPWSQAHQDFISDLSPAQADTGGFLMSQENARGHALHIDPSSSANRGEALPGQAGGGAAEQHPPSHPPPPPPGSSGTGRRLGLGKSCVVAEGSGPRPREGHLLRAEGPARTRPGPGRRAVQAPSPQEPFTRSRERTSSETQTGGPLGSGLRGSAGQRRSVSDRGRESSTRRRRAGAGLQAGASGVRTEGQREGHSQSGPGRVLPV